MEFPKEKKNLYNPFGSVSIVPTPSKIDLFFFGEFSAMRIRKHAKISPLHYYASSTLNVVNEAVMIFSRKFENQIFELIRILARQRQGNL